MENEAREPQDRKTSFASLNEVLARLRKVLADVEPGRVTREELRQKQIAAEELLQDFSWMSEQLPIPED